MCSNILKWYLSEGSIFSEKHFIPLAMVGNSLADHSVTIFWHFVLTEEDDKVIFYIIVTVNKSLEKSKPSMY